MIYIFLARLFILSNYVYTLYLTYTKCYGPGNGPTRMFVSEIPDHHGPLSRFLRQRKNAPENCLFGPSVPASVYGLKDDYAGIDTLEGLAVLVETVLGHYGILRWPHVISWSNSTLLDKRASLEKQIPEKMKAVPKTKTAATGLRKSVLDMSR